VYQTFLELSRLSRICHDGQMFLEMFTAGQELIRAGDWQASTLEIKRLLN
jgi:hypothetical protein